MTLNTYAMQFSANENHHGLGSIHVQRSLVVFASSKQSGIPFNYNTQLILQ